MVKNKAALEALSLLDRVVGGVNASRKDHETFRYAVEVIRAELVKKEPESKKPDHENEKAELLQVTPQ